MGRAAAPPNHGAAAPQRYTQAASPPPRPALALGGHRFINYTQQSNKSWRRQWRGSWGGCATGAERVRGIAILLSHLSYKL
jgi:hypothetical protein